MNSSNVCELKDYQIYVNQRTHSDISLQIVNQYESKQSEIITEILKVKPLKYIVPLVEEYHIPVLQENLKDETAFQKLLSLVVLFCIFYFLFGFENDNNHNILFVERESKLIGCTELDEINEGTVDNDTNKGNQEKKTNTKNETCTANEKSNSGPKEKKSHSKRFFNSTVKNRCNLRYRSLEPNLLSRIAYSEPRQIVSEDSLHPAVLDVQDLFDYNKVAQDDEPQESENEYGLGGYYNIIVGDTYNERYLVYRKLGWGHFSTVWLCVDTKAQELVAMKVVKSQRVYMEAAQDEINFCNTVKEKGQNDSRCSLFIKLLDNFNLEGPNGTHICLIFELGGPNLLYLIRDSKYQGLPINSVRQIMRQVLKGLQFLHDECKMIHTDIKPENILLEANVKYKMDLLTNVRDWVELNNTDLPKAYVANVPEESKCKKVLRLRELTSFINPVLRAIQRRHESFAIFDTTDGSQEKRRSCLFDRDEMSSVSKQSSKDLPPVGVKFYPDCKDIRIKIADLGNACYENHHYSEDIQTCQYRCPESILASGYDQSADIWSVACVAFELATSDFLFDPKGTDRYSIEEDLLAHFIELLGPIPKDIIRRGKRWHRYFHVNGKLKNIEDLSPWPLRDVLVEKYKFSQLEANVFADFLEKMLRYNPKERATATECLAHPFLN